MSIRKLIFLLLSHAAAVFIGFAAGIYALPILTAPPAPSAEMISQRSSNAMFTAKFVRELADSDALHWGEGNVSIANDYITLMGEIAPGPEYKLYLSPEFIETEADFERAKHTMVQVGDIKTFENFVVPVTDGVDVANYNTVIVWCEAFGEFITSAKYR
ncbi:DM13 domain-containing protein [Thalassotalea euphylliae]|uniref:DM13 domain-containing protein n=1 Tax=Thalassotalea euphylliae TaxID=1655234 RepID=UPI0036277345